MKKTVVSLFLVLLLLSFSACGKTVENVPEQNADTKEAQVESGEVQGDSTKGLPDNFVAEASGICGENLTWEYGNSILYIHGSGDMIDYKEFEGGPWSTEFDLGDRIAKIIIEDGCTSIGNRAFFDLSTLVSVEIPGSVKRIGYESFCKDIQLKNIVIPEGVETIEGFAFAGCPLESLEIPDSVTNMVENPFCDNDKIKSIKMPKKLGYVSLDYYSEYEEVTLPDDFDGLYYHGSKEMSPVFDNQIASYLKNLHLTIIWRGKKYSPEEAENLANDLIAVGFNYEGPLITEEHYRVEANFFGAAEAAP